MVETRYTISIGGDEFVIVPGSFVEGAIRRQAEFAYLGDQDLKSRPDTREFLHNSWVGGSQWEKPVYGPNNLNTYYDANDLSLTDRAGAIQESYQMEPANSGLAANGAAPSAPLIAWNKDNKDGMLSIAPSSGTQWSFQEWSGTSESWSAIGTAFTLGITTKVMASAAGVDDVYVLFSNGDIAELDVGTPTTTHNASVVSETIYNGAAMWADFDNLWVYNGDKVFSYDTATLTETIQVNDGLGPDVFSSSALFVSATAIIPEFGCTRAISTSEGIFYVKNVIQSGLPVAKVFRVDKDASGTYILTPVGTLPEGQVAINITQHLGSILVSTVPSFQEACLNFRHQKVTIYHVTGRSIGAVGSPLGDTVLDETPAWFLGTFNEMLYMGGEKRIWQYDGRVGAMHPLHLETEAQYIGQGGGFIKMATCALAANTSGIMFWHTGDGGVNSPYENIWRTDTPITTTDEDAYVISNWFDFDLPMEEKTIYEVYYDSGHVRLNSTINIQLSVDGGAFNTVATITGGTSADTARIAISPVTGFKFQYKIIFNNDLVTSADEPSRIYSVGFAAMAGEMVDIIQFTIDGKESINLENSVQVPEDVYDLMAALRANKEEVTVIHSYRQYEGNATVTGTYRVLGVTGRKDRPRDGLYEVQLVEVAT